jgi:hypothetical protein
MKGEARSKGSGYPFDIIVIVKTDFWGKCEILHRINPLDIRREYLFLHSTRLRSQPRSTRLHSTQRHNMVRKSTRRKLSEFTIKLNLRFMRTKSSSSIASETGTAPHAGAESSPDYTTPPIDFDSIARTQAQKIKAADGIPPDWNITAARVTDSNGSVLSAWPPKDTCYLDFECEMPVDEEGSTYSYQIRDRGTNKLYTFNNSILRGSCPLNLHDLDLGSSRKGQRSSSRTGNSGTDATYRMHERIYVDGRSIDLEEGLLLHDAQSHWNRFQSKDLEHALKTGDWPGVQEITKDTAQKCGKYHAEYPNFSSNGDRIDPDGTVHTYTPAKGHFTIPPPFKA